MAAGSRACCTFSYNTSPVTGGLGNICAQNYSSLNLMLHKARRRPVGDSSSELPVHFDHVPVLNKNRARPHRSIYYA